MRPSIPNVDSDSRYRPLDRRGPNRHRGPRLVAVVVAVLVLSGCRNELPQVQPPQPGHYEGTIYVDTPKVFERERLVRDRERQRQWLETQLTVSDSWFDAVQFAQQTRAAQRNAFSVGVDATAAGALGIQQTEAARDDLDRSQELAGLQHQLDVARLQAQIDAAQKGEEAPGTGSTGTTPTITGGTTASNDGTDTTNVPETDEAIVSLPDVPASAGIADRPIDRFRDRLAYRDAVRQELLDNDLDDVHDVAGNTLYRLSFDTVVLPEGDNSHWAVVEVEIQDQGAAIGCRAEADDTGKNDTGMHVEPGARAHLEGLADAFLANLAHAMNNDVEALVRAFFTKDLTTVPVETASLVRRSDADIGRELLAMDGLVAIFDEDESNYKAYWEKQEAEQKRLEHEIQAAKADDQALNAEAEVYRDQVENLAAEISSYDDSQRDSRSGELELLDARRRGAEDELGRKAREVADLKTRLARLKNELAEVNRTLRLLERLGKAPSRAALEREARSTAVAVISAVYKKARDVRSIPAKTLRIQKANHFDVLAASLPDSGGGRAETFCRLLTFLTPARIDTYTVTPRESVERLSDRYASRSEEARQLAAGLTAGTVGVQAGLERLTVLESQRDAIRRQPLAVGFSQPKNGSERSAFGWILGPRVQARYSKPGFNFRHRLSSYTLSAVVSVPAWWPGVELKVSARWVDESKCLGDTTTACATKPSTTMAVKPSTTMAVPLVGDANGLVRALFPRTRRPRPFFPPRTPTLQIGRKERLVIYGDDLWRNPKVVLGTQVASSVEILPDMRGVVATFSSVQRPANMGANQQVAAPVWIWTSEGRALVGDIQVVKAPTASQPSANLPVRIQTPNEIKVTGSRGDVSLDIDPRQGVTMQGHLRISVVGSAAIHPTSAITLHPAGCGVRTGLTFKVQAVPCEFLLPLSGLRAGEPVKLKLDQIVGGKTVATETKTYAVR